MLKITELEYTIEDYLTECDMKNLSSKTIKSYDQSLKLFVKFLIQEYKITSIKQLKKIHIEKYVKFTKEKGKYSFVINNDSRSKNHPQNRRDYEKKISVSTVNNYLRNIKAFINWCVAEKLLKDNVAKTVKHLKASRKPKEQLSNQEYKRLIGSLDTTKYVEFRDYTIINIIMDSGMRIGETLALQIKDVDLVRRAVMINADNAKSKRDRVVFFSRKTGQLLRRWIQYKDRYFETDILFPTNRCSQLKVMNFEKNFRKYVALCGIKKYVTPHSLRNNFGRRFLVNGGDIFTLSKILGHSSVTVTEQAYADLSDEDVRRNYQRFSSIENMDK